MFSCNKDSFNACNTGPQGPQGPPGTSFDISGNLDLSCNAIVDVSSIDFCQNIVLTDSVNATANIAIGNDTGYASTNTIAIGHNAGESLQETGTIAVGLRAGNIRQGTSSDFALRGDSVAIGTDAGSVNQEGHAIAIGIRSGQTDQSANAVSIGVLAGSEDQGRESIAIGTLSGWRNQGEYSVAIGESAGELQQGDHAIAIGRTAGSIIQDSSSIVINATPGALQSNGTGSFTVKPIRNSSTTDGLYYNSTTGEITYDTATGGGGGAGSWDTSFNYYFMEKPWRPAYITGGTFSPPMSYDKGTFDASSGKYDPVDQRIELNWQLPPREAAAFNFNVVPHQLNDSTVNLTNSGAPAYNQHINDISLNYLPYHESLFVDYRTKSSGTISEWTTLTTVDINLSGTPKPNLYAQTRGVYFVPGSGVSSGEYGPTAVTPTVPVFVYQNTNKLQLGADQYQFRIYLRNKSEQVLPSPDYFGTPDPSWNYLYMPDSSGSFFVFGSFGPATPPQLINVSSSQYNKLSITGSNNNPNSSNPVADASLNTPFPSLPLYNLHVNYGFDVSGSIDPSSKQVFVPPAPYQEFDVSNVYVTKDLTTNSWTFLSDISAALDVSLNVTEAANKIVFPGYTYDLSGYYMRINSDLNYNVYTDNYLPPSYPDALVAPPTRNQVSTTYTSMLSGAGQSSFFTNTDLTNGLQSGTAAVVANAYPKNSNTLISNIYFFDPTSQYQLYNALYTYELVNKRNAVESGSLGTDLCGNDLCRFVLETTSAPPTTLTSVYRVGFTGADAVVTPTNAYFELGISESKDATQYPSPPASTAEAYRLRGWYLGVDVSDVKIKDINLTSYPDISNNSYVDWDIKLIQQFAGTETDKTLTYPLRIGKVPIDPVSISGFSTVQQTPVLTVDFFGLGRPANSTVATWPVSATLSGLDPTWRPVQSQWLMNGALLYASASSAASGNAMTGGDYGQTWSNTHPTSVSMNENCVLLRTNLQSASYNYSRDRSGISPQFYITGTYTNNVTLSPSSTAVASLSISFNSLPLWWDYSTLNPSLPFSYTLHSPGVGEYPVNYGSGGYIVAYNHVNPIGDQQLMWCKTGFTSGQYTTDVDENPYVDYVTALATASYGQTQNYSSKNSTGISKNLSYTAANDDYYEGGTVTITGTYKWIMLSDTRVSATSFGKIVVTGSGGASPTLKLGDDYLLYIQEIDAYFSPTNNTVPAGYASGRSGWKAVQGTWDQGAAVNVNNADEAGAYRRKTNLGVDAVHFIKFYSPNANKQVFYRIGLKNGDNRKIANVSITYGTT